MITKTKCLSGPRPKCIFLPIERAQLNFRAYRHQFLTAFPGHFSNFQPLENLDEQLNLTLAGEMDGEWETAGGAGWGAIKKFTCAANWCRLICAKSNMKLLSPRQLSLICWKYLSDTDRAADSGRWHSELQIKWRWNYGNQNRELAPLLALARKQKNPREIWPLFSLDDKSDLCDIWWPR